MIPEHLSNEREYEIYLQSLEDMKEIINNQIQKRDD
jgi:hypothetical protein